MFTGIHVGLHVTQCFHDLQIEYSGLRMSSTFGRHRSLQINALIYIKTLVPSFQENCSDYVFVKTADIV